MIFARAKADDLDVIASLEADGFAHARWSAAAWADEIAAEDRHVLVARAADGVIGVATFSSLFDTAELQRVVVRTDRRGHGIGRRLVRAGIEWASAMGAERMLLEVERGNASARSLYDGLGFAPIALRANYYGEGLDALVMSLDLRAQVDEREYA